MTLKQKLAIIFFLIAAPIVSAIAYENFNTYEQKSVEAEDRSNLEEQEDPLLEQEAPTASESTAIERSQDVNLLLTEADIEEAMVSATTRIVADLVPADPENPYSGDYRILFNDGIDVHSADIDMTNDDAINPKLTMLRRSLPPHGEFPAGCRGVTEDEYYALDHFPKDPDSSAEFRTPELTNDLIELYQDPSFRSELLSAIGSPVDGDVALDALVVLFQNGTYDPMTVYHLCGTDGEITVAMVTMVAMYAGEEANPFYVVWNGESYENHTLPLPTGPLSRLRFLPASDGHNALVYYTEQVASFMDVVVWSFFEFDQTAGGYRMIEFCFGSSDGTGDPPYGYNYGCTPEYIP